ncbi:MAG: hypothetical protein JSR21_21395, partial [Proteobacteria bacterium]|nr:hypothetical protein [Pseudomonadota bacterium]
MLSDGLRPASARPLAAPPPAHAPEVAAPRAESPAGLRAALRARLPGFGLVADLALAPIDHLLDHAGSALRFAHEPACYYANHQTSYESFLISFLHYAVTGLPLLVVTHPGLFDNDYGEHCTLLAERLHRAGHAAAGAIEVVAVPHERDRAREFLLGLPERLKGRSLLVHVGAWRELHEAQPVATMSKDLMAVTLRLGHPVVPVRISGGLPARSLGHKFHLPYRMSRLTVAMGAPIGTDELAAIDPFRRRQRVLDAINS